MGVSFHRIYIISKGFSGSVSVGFPLGECSSVVFHAQPRPNTPQMRTTFVVSQSILLIQFPKFFFPCWTTSKNPDFNHSFSIKKAPH